MGQMTIPVGDTDLGAYTVGNEAHPSLLMIHENRGLRPYMIEVADALAEAGYRVIAPDLLSRLGGTARFASAPEEVTTRQIANEQHVEDLCAVFDHLGGVDAIVGFCFGGEMGWQLITRRTAKAAVLFYGIGPQADLVADIRTPVFAIYAEDDPRVNETLPELNAALRGSQVDYRMESFPGTKHAFHDHHRPERHDARAAAVAWGEALLFLSHHTAGA